MGRCLQPTILALLVPLLPAASAAEEVSRDSYREAVEPICRADTKANERIFAGIRGMVKHEELEGACARFRRAGIALEKTLRHLKAVPRPAADDARLSRWFTLVGAE